MIKNKTVYILGAGISKADEVPIQSELLYQIFTLSPEDFNSNTSSFLQLKINRSEQNVMKYFEAFDNQRKILADFIINNFSTEIEKEKYNNKKTVVGSENFTVNDWNLIYSISKDLNITMEDLFTLFDKVILGREHFRGYTTEMINEKQEALKKCIIFLLAYKSAKISEINNICSRFAKLIFNKRINSSYNDDLLTIITMNWDSILEKEIYRLCREYNNAGSKIKIYPDLCFYDYCFNKSDKRIISTHIKAKKNKNIKFLKLHGSINWLVCPNCKRIYVDYDEDIAIYELCYELSTERLCPECIKEFIKDNDVPRMNSILITPTFIKDLNILQLKNIWHNALIDISEASKIIIIGYSFPEADFEMRYLLKKAINQKTEIEVILHSSDNPLEYRKTLVSKKLSNDEIEKIINKLDLPEKRYHSFFNKDKISISYFGIEGYIKGEEKNEKK
ncbi:MAG: hypothetical protein FWC97_00590 [Treponema sp.]|nr:hypothetical protein [Treponema sp.]